MSKDVNIDPEKKKKRKFVTLVLWISITQRKGKKTEVEKRDGRVWGAAEYCGVEQDKENNFKKCNLDQSFPYRD